VNIELHIERLVLDGLSVEPKHRAALRSAIEEELMQLLMTGGLSPEVITTGSVRSISAGEIPVATHPAPASLGNQIAQAVHSGIGHRRADVSRQRTRIR